MRAMQRKLSGVVPAPALIVNSLLAMTQTSRIACHPAGITLDVLPPLNASFSSNQPMES